VLGIGHGQDNAGVTKRGDYNYYTSLDGGAGRNERIRYDTPSVGPFSAAVSVGNGDQASAGIKLSQDFGGTEFSAALGTIQWPGNKSTVSGSAGVKFASGITFSGAWGEGKDHAGMMIPEASPEPPAEPMETTTEATTDPSFFQWTLGYVFGDTSVGGSWYRASDTVNEDAELTAIGIGINHNLPGIGTNVYAAAQSYEVEDGAYESDDSVIMIGARIKF